MEFKFFRQPRYYGDYHCIGNACPDNCCYGWRIDWKKEEVDKLKTAPNCSSELKELIEKTFTANGALEGFYRVAFDEQNKCPLLTEDGLCRIQRELGVEYMSYTCMIYPRLNLLAEPVLYSVCCSSCREVMYHLINDEKAMDLINIPVKKAETVNVTSYSPEDLAAHPELKYCGELLEFFYEIISDKRHSVETNIIIGALAAQALTKLVERAEEDKIPETLSQLKAQMHNAAQLKAIENIKPNYHLRFRFIGDVLREMTKIPVINLLNDQTGLPNIDYYNEGSEKLNEAFKDRPFFLRNIALNLLMELAAVPFKLLNKSIFENYSLFAVVFACLKLNMIATAVMRETNLNLYGKNIHYSSEEKFYGFSSMICRGLCQNAVNRTKIVNLLKENGFTSPAYIALLVK